MPALRNRSAKDLLDLGAGLPGSFRYARDPRPSLGAVLLVGELRRDGDDGPPEDQAVLSWLGRLGAGDPPGGPPSEEALEDALNESGLGFLRRDSSWIAAALPGLTGGLAVSRVGDGARVEAVLATWDEIAPECAEALAEFLLAAQAGLRCARCELGTHAARAVAQVRTEDLGRHLIHSLRGVAVAARLLAREASALLVPQAAHIYLELRTRPASGPCDLRSGR
jgi:hypothetical protein